MSLIIAIILIVIVLCRVSVDKAGHAAYEKKKSEWQISTAEFESKYVSKQLETQLHLADTDNRMLMLREEEIVRAIEEMRTYCEPNEMLVRRRWLDVMLAHRGKVSSRASFDGYEAHGEMTNGSITPQSLREQEYAFVEWVRDTLKKQGIELTPVFIRGNTGRPFYAWLGSFAAPDPPFGSEMARLPFTRGLIKSLKVSDIPRPYYGDKPNEKEDSFCANMAVNITADTRFPETMWFSRFVCAETEKAIKAKYIGSTGEAKGTAIIDILSVIKELPEWEGNTDYLWTSDVLDILLAKEGLISSYANHFGYGGCVGTTSGANRRRALTAWIQKTVSDKTGEHLDVKESGTSYIWVGSDADLRSK